MSAARVTRRFPTLAFVVEGWEMNYPYSVGSLVVAATRMTHTEVLHQDEQTLEIRCYRLVEDCHEEVSVQRTRER